MSPTRYRAGQQPSLLDLVITNERHFVDQVTINAPLGHSDHCVLTFDFICYWARNPEPQTWIRNFCRADFSGMRIFLNQVKLGPASVEDLYKTIVQKVHEADAMFVLKKPARSRMSRRLLKRIRRLLEKSALQIDVDAAKQWSLDRHLPLDDEKCVHMSFGGDSTDSLVMHGRKGPEGITRIDAKRIWVSFSLHLEKSAQKAFAVLRTLSYITRTDFQILYGAYVRPLLEYANPVVYSGRTKDVILIERVQRAATKMWLPASSPWTTKRVTRCLTSFPWSIVASEGLNSYCLHIDCMHAVCLGVVRRLVSIFLNGDRAVLIEPAGLSKIDHVIRNIPMCSRSSHDEDLRQLQVPNNRVTKTKGVGCSHRIHNKVNGRAVIGAGVRHVVLWKAHSPLMEQLSAPHRLNWLSHALGMPVDRMSCKTHFSGPCIDGDEGEAVNPSFGNEE
ncbi:hypothetical protein CLF_100081 [Clonorchis sinensis]|uniref:Endonuclease/exonuclease/phosphatase domain-containing protein n=1 Tax=Clonorchis sinensis TaxID=79923 RepID=G7Y2K9_CLOSI|nr:hypothetical protein CLF_100081 [Clonorchis sinensis]